MSDEVKTLDYRPFAPPLPPGRARAIPWVTVAAGSLVAILPAVAQVPLLPPLGLLMLLTWRLLARFSLRPWAPVPLGLFDDLLSGQPLGSAALLWVLCFLAIEAAEARLVVRTFWQDWAMAAALAAAVLAAGRLIAAPLDAPLLLPVAAQALGTALLLPVAARAVARIDRRRNYG